MKQATKTNVAKKTVVNAQNRRASQMQHKKKRRRRKNLSLYYLMLFVVVSCAFVLLSLTVFFRIDTIKISGTSDYSPEEIIAASGIRKGDNLIRLDRTKVSEHVESQLANIEISGIKKKFPSEVILNVKPADPYAVILDNKIYYSISKSGKVLSSSAENNSGLILITGLDAKELKLNKYVTSNDDKKNELLKSISDNLDALSFTGITEINITERFDIKLVYQNRIHISIGGPTELAYKIKFAKVTIDEKIAQNFSGNLIIRDNGGASIIPN